MIKATRAATKNKASAEEARKLPVRSGMQWGAGGFWQRDGASHHRQPWDLRRAEFAVVIGTCAQRASPAPWQLQKCACAVWFWKCAARADLLHRARQPIWEERFGMALRQAQPGADAIPSRNPVLGKAYRKHGKYTSQLQEARFESRSTAERSDQNYTLWPALPGSRTKRNTFGFRRHDKKHPWENDYVSAKTPFFRAGVLAALG